MSIDVKNLCFSYSENKVLDDVTFSVCDGDFLMLLGENGAGKTTLFKLLLGFLPHYSGEIEINGQNIKNMSANDFAKNVSYVSQMSSPVFDYTVLDTVLMGMTNSLPKFSSPKAEHIKRAKEILSMLSIEHLANRGIGQISGGERQLTMLARSLAQGAKILVLDEPCASLDYSNRFKVMNKISRLTKRGYTVIMSTHDPNQAFLYANKVLTLKNGKVLSFGEPKSTLNEKVLSQLYGITIAKEEVTLSSGREFTICIPEGGKRNTISLWQDDMVAFMTKASLYGNYNSSLADIISKYLDKNDTICDAGCGLGFLSFELTKKGFDITAVDSNEKAISVLNENSNGLANINAICTDLFSYETDEKFSAMIFNYFGNIEEIITLSKKLCKNKIIIVKRSDKKSGFSLDQNESRNSFSKISEYLDKEKIRYTKEEAEIEFGQPFENTDEAVKFFELYKNPDSPKATKEDVLSLLIKTDDEKYPLYYPHKKQITVAVIDVKDL